MNRNIRNIKKKPISTSCYHKNLYTSKRSMSKPKQNKKKQPKQTQAATYKRRLSQSLNVQKQALTNKIDFLINRDIIKNAVKKQPCLLRTYYLNKVDQVYEALKQNAQIPSFAQYFLGKVIYKFRRQPFMSLKDFQNLCLQNYKNSDESDINTFINIVFKAKANKPITYSQSSFYNSRRNNQAKRFPNLIRSHMPSPMNQNNNLQNLDLSNSNFSRTNFFQGLKRKDVVAGWDDDDLALKRIQHKLNSYFTRYAGQFKDK